MMRLSVILHRYIWMPWALLTLAALVYATMFFLRPPPPLRFLGAAAHPSVVHVGENVTVTYHTIRKRSCASTVVRGWVDPIGSIVMRFPQTYGGVGRLGEQKNKVIVPAPDAPGFYCLRMVTHHQCGAAEYDIAAPEACLEVTP